MPKIRFPNVETPCARIAVLPFCVGAYPLRLWQFLGQGKERLPGIFAEAVYPIGEVGDLEARLLGGAQLVPC